MGQLGGNRLSTALCLLVYESNSFIKHLCHLFQQGLHSWSESLQGIGVDCTGMYCTETTIRVGSDPAVVCLSRQAVDSGDELSISQPQVGLRWCSQGKPSHIFPGGKVLGLRSVLLHRFVPV